MDAKLWARIIQDGATDEGVQHVIRSINRLTDERIANHGDVMVACAQILGQSIVLGGSAIAAEMRAGLIALIEGYATRVAVSLSDAD